MELRQSRAVARISLSQTFPRRIRRKHVLRFRRRFFSLVGFFGRGSFSGQKRDSGGPEDKGAPRWRGWLKRIPAAHFAHINLHSVGPRKSPYSVWTSTTPDTALIAPAICGDTLNRPGSFISTSVWRSSIMTNDTSPSPPPAADAF